MAVKLGWKAGPEQFPPMELLDCVVAAEQAGFETVDSSDHFHPWSEAGQASFVWTWLGAAAARTSKIELGTGVTCPILRCDPAVIAQAAATLACLAPGRVYLGVGTGEAVGADTIRQKRCISRNVEDHVRFIQPYVDMGFTHLYFHSAHPDQRGFLERYGRDVLPRLRQLQPQGTMSQALGANGR